MHPPRRQEFVIADMELDDHGNCAALHLDGRVHIAAKRVRGHLCERAQRETGCTDSRLLLVQFARARTVGRHPDSSGSPSETSKTVSLPNYERSLKALEERAAIEVKALVASLLAECKAKGDVEIFGARRKRRGF